MTEIAPGGDTITNELLELFHLGKSLLGSAGPDDIIANSNLEDTSRAGLKRYFSHLILKRSQQFLGCPCSAQKPAALSAILNFDPWQTLAHLLQVYMERLLEGWWMAPIESGSNESSDGSVLLDQQKMSVEP
jgi:hypothetical protein